MISVGNFGDPCDEKYVEWLKARAERLVNRVWTSIEFLAAALVERRRLTGQQIDILLERSAYKVVH